MKQSRLRQFFVLLSLLSLVMGIFVSMDSILSERILSPKRYSELLGGAKLKSLQVHKSSKSPKCNSTAKEVCESMGTDQNTSISNTMTNETSAHPKAIVTLSSNKNDTSAIQSKGTSVNISGARKWRQLGKRKDIFVYSAYYRKEMRDIVTIGVGRRKKNQSIVCSFPLSQGHPQVKASVEVIPEHHNCHFGGCAVTSAAMKQSRLRQFFVLLSLLSLVMGIFVSMDSILSERILSPKRYSELLGGAKLKSLQVHKSSKSPKCNSTAKEVCESMGTDQNTSISNTMTNETSAHPKAIVTLSSNKNDTSAIQSKGTSVNISGARKWRQLGKRKDIFVYSAYYRKEMRDIVTIGVGRRKKNQSIVCSFPLSQGHPQVKASVEVIPEHHNCQNSAIYIKCSLGNETTHIPSAVQLKVGTDSTRLSILFPKPRRFNFTVCFACLHGTYNNHKQLIEIIETDLILGAQHFVIYNHSISYQVNMVLRHYVRRGLVEIRPWHLPKMDVHYYGQMATIQDCILSSRNESKYLVLKDVDEVIAPHQHQNWDQMMRFLDGKGNHSTFLFRNAFFGTTWTQYNPDKLKTQSISSLKYIWRDKKVFRQGIRSKAILKPELVHVGGIHSPFQVEKYCDVVPVNTSVALLHHYRKYNQQKKKVKDPTMLKYYDELLSNTKKTYKELDLL